MKLSDLITSFTELSDDELFEKISTLKRKRLVSQKVKEIKKKKEKTSLDALAARFKALGIKL